MAEYELTCDACGEACEPADAVVSWTSAEGTERSFALTHAAHVPEGATDRVEARRLVWPNGYLQFITERFGARVADPEPLRAIAWALAPFVMRHDNAAEMDGIRAASFGAVVGVKPGTQPSAAALAGKPAEVEGGK